MLAINRLSSLFDLESSTLCCTVVFLSDTAKYSLERHVQKY
jgi:hypothetical protein